MNAAMRRKRYILRNRRRGIEIEPQWGYLDIASGLMSAWHIMRLVSDPVMAQQVRARSDDH